MRSTPRALYSFASIIWAETADEDPRSAIYEAVEEKLTRGSGAPVAARPYRWLRQLHEYEAFWTVSGKAPRENTRDRPSLPAEERRSGEWARYQRRFERDLNSSQHIRLDVSPAFEWDPWEATWQRKLRAYASHLARTGRLPTLDSTDQKIFALARWFTRQLQLLQTGMLADHRAAAIKNVLAVGLRHR
jgi:hypothetical protein